MPAMGRGNYYSVDVQSSRSATILLPQYSNMTSVREWPSEINLSGPTLRTDKGFFTYSPAMAYQGLLSQSISTATTMDGSPRQHSKFQIEFSVYLGHTSNSIVAFGVAAANTGYNPRYLGIAAGSDYGNLNQAQCRTRFIPTLFDISVALSDRTITITPTNADAIDIEPSGTLTHVLERQFELSSNDMSNIYQSVIGNALNFSIADYRKYVRSSHYTGSPLGEQDINLGGIQNSVTAMIDDLLVTYSSAQLMIANDTKTVDATVTVTAVRLGQPVYIYLVFGFNLLIVLGAAMYRPEEEEESGNDHFWRIFDSETM
ncbi:hypothetical protein EYC80_006545 [Monilinia laxa]|uniref:Uncharacterized protein n=1 Tax=Monilinia laxa TaxID=61186 RepID=A0A5N6JV09_MONLA|nr:hypothetical protein EYC80_006545 [Monilinia laxa]